MMLSRCCRRGESVYFSNFEAPTVASFTHKRTAAASPTAYEGRFFLNAQIPKMILFNQLQYTKIKFYFYTSKKHANNWYKCMLFQCLLS